MFAAVAGWASAPVKLYPGVARLAGANNTAWRSSAVLHNPTASTQSALLELLPRGGSAVAASATVHLAVGETREIANLYDFLGAADGAGMLRVTGSVIAWVRAYNEGNGTFGQDLPAVSPGTGFAPNSAITFPFSTPTDIKRDFRSNLMLVNLGASDVTVTIISGASVGTQVVPAGAYVQINNLGAFLRASPGFRAAQVSADGEWFGAIATIDPFTGDPTTVWGLASSDPGERYFPSIAQIAGKNGAAWRSEAVFYNPTDAPVSTTLELIPRGESQVAASTSLTLGPGETRRIGNLYDFLGVPAGAGTLRVTGAALAWLRSYNQRPHAGDTAMETFGQDLPPVASEGGIPARAFVALPFNNPADTATGFRSNLVLLNLEDHDITVSLRAGGITKTQAVPAGAYVQIDKLGAFLGGPVGESCVWGTADGRWATAIATIDPFTNDPTTFRAVEEWRPPSSSDLIDQALASHLITGEQALTYKVFADFQDPRLPAGLRGDDRGIIEPDSLDQASRQFASLSTATQDLIGPFLVPPFLKGSSWDQRHGGGGASVLASGTAAEPCRPWRTLCGILSGSWEHVTGAHVRVWFLSSNRATDLAIADDLVAQAEFHIWAQLMTVMGTKPLLTDLGDGPHLDIELVDPTDWKGDETYGQTVPYPGYCRAGPDHILINRALKTLDLRRGTLAHELMHACQDSLDTDFCNRDKGYHWLKEATATWFEDYSYPDGDTEQVYAWMYLASTSLSLDDTTRVKDREYSTYLFFFYLTRVRGLKETVIGDIWRATHTMDALNAVAVGMAENGAGLDVLWPEFALYCWNEASPFNAFTLDRLKVKAEMQRDLPVNVAPDGSIPLGSKDKLGLPYLSIRYFHFDFPDANISSVAFWNGETFDLSEQEDPLLFDVGRQYVTNPASDEATKGGHVDALIKIKGVWTHEDWLNIPYRAFCRDMAAERIEELVIIVSNSELKDRARVLKPPGVLAPMLWESNMGCWRWRGTAQYGQPLRVLANQSQAVWTRVQASPADPYISYHAEGTGTSQYSGFCKGSSKFTVDPAGGDLKTYNFAPADSSFRRAYWGHGYSGESYGITCGGTSGFMGAVYAWITIPQPWPPDFPFFRVSADGKTMEGVFTNMIDTSSWTFTAERQP